LELCLNIEAVSSDYIEKELKMNNKLTSEELILFLKAYPK
jgi:hypothetical protein